MEPLLRWLLDPALLWLQHRTSSWDLNAPGDPLLHSPVSITNQPMTQPGKQLQKLRAASHVLRREEEERLWCGKGRPLPEEKINERETDRWSQVELGKNSTQWLVETKPIALYAN